jgi:Tfp pilus assembly protein PilF
MVRGWLAILAVLAGVSLSYAAGSTGSLLAREKQWEEAREYLAEGKAPEAKAAFEALLTRYPGEPDLHLFLGITFMRLRDPKAAEEATNNAIAMDPNHIEARTLLGWIESEIHGNLDAAVEQYSKVVELRPDSWEARNNLGVAFKRKGEPDKAAASFTQALKLRPDYGAALSNRGWVFAQQNRWREAQEDFEFETGRSVSH